MKPFDLELAKKGHPVCTRDGRDARIICYDAKTGEYPIIALVYYAENGLSLLSMKRKRLCQKK